MRLLVNRQKENGGFWRGFSDNKREDKDKSQGEVESKSRDGVEGEIPALSPSAEAQCWRTTLVSLSPSPGRQCLHPCKEK